MGYDIDWIIPKLRNPTRLWNFASNITFVAVGIFSKILIDWLNKTTVYNKHIIEKALGSRPKNVPLITVSNHHSCFDDPGAWGKCVPVVRGKGIYQEAMDFCIEKLSCGDWVHVFPEGKVNMLKENIRLKWGIARLILESPVVPMVVPVCHLGMDQVLPNEPPYILKTRQKVTLNYGEPIDFSQMLTDLKKANVSDVDARIAITNRIQDELYRLKDVTEELHRKL